MLVVQNIYKNHTYVKQYQKQSIRRVYLICVAYKLNFKFN